MHITSELTDKKQETNLTELKFIGKVSTMGKRRIIYIPDEYHKCADKLLGKQVRVRVDDEISYD